MMNVRNLLLTALLLLSAAAGTHPMRAQSPPDTTRPPNIVLIMADDLGYGHLGSYGQTKIQTPNLDRMAAEGIRLTQFYAGESVCAPSRSVLMTGMHNGHTRVRANGPGMYLMPVDVTLAEVLKQGGYATGLFGKWGLGDAGTTGVPNRQGFDTFYGQLHQVHAHFYYPYWIWHNDQRYALFENEGEQQNRYVQDMLHEQALHFIRSHQGEPFFAYLSYLLPHVELTVPNDAKAPYLNDFPRVPIEDPREGYLADEHGYAAYAGMVSRLDRQVGEVMQLLEDLDLDENTLVIFTSDNGPQGGPWSQLVSFFDGNGPLRGVKGQLYEGGIRVPLIARWPGRIGAGTTSDHPGYFPDLMPTLAEAAGVSAPENVDGVSLMPTLLTEEGQKQHEYMYWAHYAAHGPPRSQAVRSGRWKAVQPGPEAAVELYDLRTDSDESDDVAGGHPNVLQGMKEYMRRAHDERYPFVGVPQSTRADFVR